MASIVRSPARTALQRKYDLAEALKLVVATATWRREKNVRAIATNDPYDILGCAEDELLFFYPKTYFPLPDAEGRPIYAEKGGVADIEAMLLLVDHDMSRMVDYHIYGNEMYMRNLCVLPRLRAFASAFALRPLLCPSSQCIESPAASPR